jgi:uroporphyrinogen-III synthase
MKSAGFSGLQVLSLESRRAQEIAHLIQSNGGQPVIAPSTREIPLAASPEIANFVSALLQGQFRAVIFLTGVGARALAAAADAFCPRQEFVAALGRTAIIARGPKPVAALRELGVPITFTVPEPNTWREVLQVLDANADKLPMQGQRFAIQEHGAPSKELLDGLAERGAVAVPIHVYEWALPEDKAPLKAAVSALIHKEIDIVLFTASVQLQHLLEVAGEMEQRDELRRALNQTVVASIGPTTSQTLKSHDIAVDMEPSHPRMGFLVKEAAERSAELLRAKRAL